MDGGCGVWQSLCALWRWLFVAECANAASLLSLGFAVNSIFTGLSLSRFNLCAWMKRRALKCVDGTLAEGFLSRLELLGRDSRDIRVRLARFRDDVRRYRESMRGESSSWEPFRRFVTVCCAAAAFVLTAFDVKTRVGFALGLPYIVILMGHAILVSFRTRGVMASYRALVKAMDENEKFDSEKFDVDGCMDELRIGRVEICSLEPPARKGRRK